MIEKLNELVEFKNGKKRPTEKGIIPVYGGNGILGYTNQFNAEQNNLIIGRVGAYCGCVYKCNGKCWISDNAIVGNVRQNVDYNFAYYLLKSLKLNKRHIGSGQPLMTQSILNSIKVEVPDYSTQKKIGKILNDIDNQINANNYTNDNLCQLCKQVFYGKILNFIGEKTIFTFNDLVDTINGYSYSGTELSESSKVGMATIKNFKRSGGFKADGFKSIKPSNVKKNNYVDVGDLLIACTDLTQNAGIIGNTIMIFSKGGYAELIASMDLLKIIPKTKKYSKDLLYELFNTAIFKNYAVGCTSGTTVLHLNKKALREFQIALPKDAEYIKIIDDQLASCHRIIGKNIIENERLIKLRDTLLPELLNGKVDVSNIDI